MGPTPSVTGWFADSNKHAVTWVRYPRFNVAYKHIWANIHTRYLVPYLHDYTQYDIIVLINPTNLATRATAPHTQNACDRALQHMWHGVSSALVKIASNAADL